MRLAGIAAPVPGGLQRFNLVLNVTSSLRPGEQSLSAIKGVVTDSLRAWWTEYAPVVVASLPYPGYAPVRLAARAMRRALQSALPPTMDHMGRSERTGG